MRFSGVYSVLPTPFTQSGAVDDDSLKRIVDQAVAAGVDGVTVLGVTSEVARLDERERRHVLQIIAAQIDANARRIQMVAMTGFAYPEALVEIVTLYKSGRIDEAADVFYDFVPLMRFEFQEGIGMAIRKEVLRRRGVMGHAGVRAPGAVLDAGTLAALDRLLSWTKNRRRASWIAV